MRSTQRFDIAVVLIPRTPGDAIVRLGEAPQSLKDDAASLLVVEQTLDALDRAFHPATPGAVQR